MAAIPPGALINWIEQRCLKLVDGILVPNAAGTLTFLATDGVTPKVTYSDPDLEEDHENVNPIELDSDGRPPVNIYLDRGGYTVIVKDSDDVELYTVNIEDTAGTFLSALAAMMSEGSLDVPDGYEILVTDKLVTTDPNEVADPMAVILPDVATWTGPPLTIKNLSASVCEVTPHGGQDIETLDADATWDLPAAADDVNPTIVLIPKEDETGWWIQSSHGL